MGLLKSKLQQKASQGTFVCSLLTSQSLWLLCDALSGRYPFILALVNKVPVSHRKSFCEERISLSLFFVSVGDGY